MRSPRIQLSETWFDAREAERIAQALEGRVAGNGPFCQKVEGRLQQLLGGRRVLLTTSCTHAMELALLALGVGPGDEVICPSFTFVSTANAVLRMGARPVLADAGCFSFHETKNVTCGEGGAVTFADAAVAERAEVIREKGTNRSAFLRGEVDKYTWVAEGSSYVLSDVLAAMLDAQLDKLEEIQVRRARVASRYREELGAWAQAHGARLPATDGDRQANDHLFYVLLPDEETRERGLSGLAPRC